MIQEKVYSVTLCLGMAMHVWVCGLGCDFSKLITSSVLKCFLVSFSLSFFAYACVHTYILQCSVSSADGHGQQMRLHLTSTGLQLCSGSKVSYTCSYTKV